MIPMENDENAKRSLKKEKEMASNDDVFNIQETLLVGEISTELKDSDM